MRVGWLWMGFVEEGERGGDVQRDGEGMGESVVQVLRFEGCCGDGCRGAVLALGRSGGCLEWV